jgi:hypothetical protein
MTKQMRKTILLLAFVAITAISFGQKTDSIAQKIDSIDCSRVTKTVDEFSGEITYEARITDDVNFLKIKKNGVIKYYLSIWIKETGIYTGTGVSIILKNGKKINKPSAKVEYNYAGSSFYTTTFIQLTNEDIALLKQSGIEKFKLYISTGEITDYSDLSKDLFNCLVKAK